MLPSARRAAVGVRGYTRVAPGMSCAAVVAVRVEAARAGGMGGMGGGGGGLSDVAQAVSQVQALLRERAASENALRAALASEMEQRRRLLNVVQELLRLELAKRG